MCTGDDGGPSIHPCRRVQEALKAKGIEYDKEVAAHGSPIPFLRKGSRDELEAKTGAKKLPVMRLPDGTMLTHSRDDPGLDQAAALTPSPPARALL